MSRKKLKDENESISSADPSNQSNVRRSARNSTRNAVPIKLKKKPVNGVLKSSQNKMPAKNVKLTDGVPSIEGTAEETEKAEKIPKRATRKSANGLDENSESTSDEKPSRRSARKSIKESDEVESTKETRRPTRKSMKSGINDDELIQAPIKRPTRRSTNAPVEAKENGIAPTTTTQTEEHLIQAPTKRSTRKAVSRPVQEEASISLCNNELTEASTEKAIVELTIAHCSATIASAEEKEPPKRVSNRLRSKRPAEQNLPRSLKKRLIVQDDESTKIEIEETSMNDDLHSVKVSEEEHATVIIPQKTSITITVAETVSVVLPTIQVEKPTSSAPIEEPAQKQKQSTKILREVINETVSYTHDEVEESSTELTLVLESNSMVRIDKIIYEPKAESPELQTPPVSEELQRAESSEKDPQNKQSKIPLNGGTPKPEKPRYKQIDECIIRCDADLVTTNDKARKCTCKSPLIDPKHGNACSDSSCLNRATRYECPKRCANEERCENRRFQNKQYAKIERFFAGKKGWGVRALKDIPKDAFIIEYVGEIIDSRKCNKRSRRYANNPKHKHHYLMSLTPEIFIDATKRGNIARFINHSCEPNAVTQKWTVDKRNRIGFFALKDIQAGEEIVFDYQFERFGKRAQKCFCGSANCRGIISAAKDDKDNVILEGDVGSQSDSISDSSDESEDEEVSTPISPVAKKEMPAPLPTVKREEVVDPVVTERWKKLPFNNYRIPRKSDLKQQGSAQKSPDSDSQLDTNGHVARTPEHIPDPPVSISRTPEIPIMPKKRRRSRFEPISPETTKLVETLESPKLVEPPHVERPHQYLKNNNNGPQKIIHVYAGANAFAPPFIPPPTMYPFSGPFSHWALNVAALGQQQCESDLDSILIPPPPPPPLS